MNLTLDQERIDAMHRNVMRTIDADVRRKRRRYRTTFALAAASAAVIGIGGLGVNQWRAGQTANDAASSSAHSSHDSAALLQDTVEASDGSLNNQLGKSASDDVSTAQDREVVTTGSIEMNVSDVTDSGDRIIAFTERKRGRIDSRSEFDDSSHLTIRVPAEQVTATIEFLRGLGTVKGVDISHVDVTSTARDLDARIDALGISIDRLKAILADAASSSAVIQAENALTDRQSKLERLQSERRLLAEEVSLSTIDISLTSSKSADAVSSSGFRGGLVDGWNALVDVINGTVALTGLLLPWIGALAALFVIYLIVRSLSRRIKTST